MTLSLNNAEDSCLKNQVGIGQGLEPNAENGQPYTLNTPERAKESLPVPQIDQNPSNDGENPTSPSSEQLENFPEGGLTAWLVVFGSFCAMICIYGLINTSAVFESYFKNNQLRDYSHSEIGWIFSLYLFLVFFVGVQVGPLFDNFGPRVLVAAGCLLIVTSLMLLSLSESKSLSPAYLLNPD